MLWTILSRLDGNLFKEIPFPITEEDGRLRRVISTVLNIICKECRALSPFGEVCSRHDELFDHTLELLHKDRDN